MRSAAAIALMLLWCASALAALPTLTVDAALTLDGPARQTIISAVQRAQGEGSCDEPGCASAAKPSSDVSARIHVARASVKGCRVTIRARRPGGHLHRASANTGCDQQDLAATAALLWRSGLALSLAGRAARLVTVVVVDDDDQAANHKAINADALLAAARQRRDDAVDADALLATAKRPAGARFRTIVDAAFAMQLVGRQFSFNDAVDPRQPAALSATAMPSLGVELSVYPFVPLSRSRLAELGVRFAYRGTLGADAILPGAGSAIGVTHDNTELGLRYRWNILRRASSVQLTFGLAVGYQRMAFENSPFGPRLLPNVSHTYIKLTPLDARVPFYASRVFGVGAEAHFAYLGVLSSGEINSDTLGGWGASSGNGLDVGAGLFIRLHIFELATTFDYRRIAMSFDGTCYRERLGCSYAGGAVDETTLLSIRAAVRY